MSDGWHRPLRLHELARGPVSLALAPDDGERAAVAKRLGLSSLPALKAQLTVKPWLDGAEIAGRFDAIVGYVCGVTLEPFEQAVSGEIHARAVPAGSPNAPAETGGGEMELDLEADDPPDVLPGDALDLAEYVVEHLSLEIDPFPRKPGATFDYASDAEEESPFAVLKKLKDPKP
ncbi:YceD family protein [Phenylobacterium sp.]|uniref:YceD family protein n=1 Tax=Phenylobacterium sp. TaxID=1871053 RepID=UPI00393A1976